MSASDGGFWLVGLTGPILSTDIYVVRLNALGNIVWSRTYGGPQSDWVSSVLPTPDGGRLLVGSTNSFGAGGTRDIYLLRLNAAGDVVWSRTYGGSDTDEWAIAIPTSDEGLLLAGSIQPTSPMFADSDTLLVKLDASGNIQWGRKYDLSTGCGPYTSCEGASSLTQTSDGNFVIGQTFSYTDYRTGAEHSIGLLLKVDNHGNVLNYWKLENDSARTSISALLATDDGSFLIRGGTDTGAVLARLDTSGTVTWKQGYAFPKDSGASTILQTPDGGFLLVGSTFLTGRRSGYAVKISSIGDIQWSRAYPINLPDRPSAGFNEVALTSDGGFLMAGDVWPSPTTGNPDYDLYVVRTDAAGNSCNAQMVAAPTPNTPNFTIAALSVPTTSPVSLTIGTPNTQSSDVVTQSADLCRYLLYLPMAVKTP